MKIIYSNINYVEWLSAEHMHEASKEWHSELSFIKDEHMFFEDLIKSYTLKLINREHFAHNKKIIDAINKSEKTNNALIKVVEAHENNLKYMTDGMDQPELEISYKKEHRELIIKISEFKKNYKILKRELFEIIKNIKKQEKKQFLIDTK